MSESPDPGPADDVNSRIIAEFRANEGRVGGPFEGAPMILVHHRGRSSGVERVTPLVYRPEDDRYVIFGSKAGAKTDPDWCRNLRANPETTVEVGTEVVPVLAREAQGEERERIWEAQKAAAPGFAEYEVKAAPRQIPVLVLTPRR